MVNRNVFTGKGLLMMIVSFLFIFSCTTKNHEPMKGSFEFDVEFLQKYTQASTLQETSGNGKILIVPEFQGRVMTSSLQGDQGTSFGWINYDLIASGETLERFNPYGGEDRFWLGPEGGQYSLYHGAGGPFTLDNWYVPKQVDILPYDLLKKDKSSAEFEKDFDISNYSGTTFSVKVNRVIRIFERNEVGTFLEIEIGSDISVVGFESRNTLTNIGDESWQKEKGLISIWILGMYNPGAETVICIPYTQGDTVELGPIMNDTYFGKVPEDRLKAENGVIYFSADGKYRSKIGLNWPRCKNILGSYDPILNVLTIVQFNKPQEQGDYAKAMWEIMTDPYEGDVINSYNDGEPEPGVKPLGPFYELETSSPVKELNPGGSMVQIHRTFHLQGEKMELEEISVQLLGVSLDQIADALN